MNGWVKIWSLRRGKLGRKGLQEDRSCALKCSSKLLFAVSSHGPGNLAALPVRLVVQGPTVVPMPI